MRRAHKVDANQAAIVQALRAAGCQVAVTSSLGDGFPDLVVYTNRARLRLVEVKDGSKPPSARKLTPAEARFFSRWPVLVVTSPQDAITQVLR